MAGLLLESLADSVLLFLKRDLKLKKHKLLHLKHQYLMSVFYPISGEPHYDGSSFNINRMKNKQIFFPFNNNYRIDKSL